MNLPYIIRHGVVTAPWGECDQGLLEEMVRMTQRFARLKYGPFTSWEGVLAECRQELAEFEESVARGDPNPNELVGCAAVALLGIIELTRPGHTNTEVA